MFLLVVLTVTVTGCFNNRDPGKFQLLQKVAQRANTFVLRVFTVEVFAGLIWPYGASKRAACVLDYF